MKKNLYLWRTKTLLGVVEVGRLARCLQLESGQFRPMGRVAIGSRIDYCTLMGIIYQVVGTVVYYPLVGSPEPRSDSIQ